MSNKPNTVYEESLKRIRDLNAHNTSKNKLITPSFDKLNILKPNIEKLDINKLLEERLKKRELEKQNSRVKDEDENDLKKDAVKP